VITALAIFAVTYLALTVQPLPWLHLDRPAAAVCGAVAMVAAGALTTEQAFAAINLDTIALLLGVMIIASYLVEAKFFRGVAWWVLTHARSARSLLWALVFASGALSALLVNDTVCLMVTPLVLAVTAEAGLPPLPYLIALATATNLGGVVTFTGNPQNMIVGMAAAGSPGYAEYFVLALPIGVLCLAADAALIAWLFRAQLPPGPLPRRNTPRPEGDGLLRGKALGALLLFVTLAAAGYSLAAAAMLAAALLMLVARVAPRQALRRVDWELLLFFAGLFIVVHGVERSGALEHAFAALRPVIARGDWLGWLAFAGLTLVASNLVSNVPFVVIAVTWVPDLPDSRFGYLMLAVVSTLAGNLTLFGSVANLIVFEIARERQPIRYLEFLRYGAILTAATLAIALAILFALRALGA
jgi:Na+/H+ antiporter NhaD/arsenite permease-like protein